MRRPVIAGIAIGAAVVLVAGAVVGVIAYQSATASLTQTKPAIVSASERADYQEIVNDWPYPFAPGDAVPKLPPRLSDNAPSPQNDRAYVSFFYQCSWINALLNGPESTRADALASLEAWNDLPETVSSVENGDRGWKTAVLEPAVRGDLRPVTSYFDNCEPYRDTRTTPSRGLTIDGPVPIDPPSPSASASPVGSVGSCPITNAIDSGPAPAARGTTTLNAAGLPVVYKVASGDIYINVAQRFGLSDACLYVLNCVRRDIQNPFELYVGDLINLDWSTVKSVGASNGRVHNNQSCFDSDPPYPPQR